jgi:hypothetical protein
MAVARLFIPVAAVIVATGCAKPTNFSLGEGIPMGSFNLSVSHAEVSALDGRAQSLVVHYRCEGIDSPEKVRRFKLMFIGQITVTDRDGNEYSTLPPMPLAAYRSRQKRGSMDSSSMGDTPGAWVAVAKVPNGSRGLTLRIKNPDQREGQPSEALIDLRR